MMEKSCIYYAPLEERGAHCLHLSVGMSINLSLVMDPITLPGMPSVDTLCPKSPSVRGFIASLTVRLLFKYLSHNAFYPIHCRNAALKLRRRNRVKFIVLYVSKQYVTGKDATKPRALGLLGHSGRFYMEI